MRTKYITNDQVAALWDTKPIVIEFADGTDALAQENGYTLEQCLAMTDARFYVDVAKFTPTKEYMEVSLQEGLNTLQTERTNKLFSDGLDAYSYIYFDKEKGFCYEGGCVIGGTFDQTLDRLHSARWCYKHKFFIKRS